jgi:hypothetical protein
MFEVRLPLVGLLALAMTGCAGVSVSPSKLRPATEAKTIELTQPVRWKYDSGLGFGYWEYQLVAGSYKPTLEDNNGTYYWGPKPTCLYQTAIIESKPPQGNSLQCVIFLPRKAGESPVVFVVNGSMLMQHAFNADKTPIIDQVDPGVTPANPPDTTSTVAAIAANSVPYNATPMQAGLGAGIAAGIIAVISESEHGNLVQFNKQPPAGWLQTAK